MRIGLVVEYEGTEFSGSQLQAMGRTVQGEIERALKALFHDRIRVKMASRTDAGVHARGQVAAFDFDTKLTMTTIRDAMNHYLPEDIGVREAAQVPDAFDPRRHAVARQYVYSVNDGEVPPTIDRRTEVHVHGPLDEGRMATAARCLEGTHDFAAFCGGALAEGASTTRRMDATAVIREGERVRIEFRANAYLNQQVRRMAGTLIQVGAGAAPARTIEELLAGRERGAAKDVAPPHGLCLTRIEYQDGGQNGLPAPIGA